MHLQHQTETVLYNRLSIKKGSIHQCTVCQGILLSILHHLTYLDGLSVFNYIMCQKGQITQLPDHIPNGNASTIYWRPQQKTIAILAKKEPTGKQLRENLPAWTLGLLGCSFQPSQPCSAQHTTFNCVKSGSTCELDLCMWVCLNIYWVAILSHMILLCCK